MKKDLEKLRHAYSAKDFPKIKLDEDEHVVISMKRSFLGLIGLWLGGAICLIAMAVLVAIVFSDNFLGDLELISIFGGPNVIWLAFFLVFIIIIAMTAISTYVYIGNKMYITNKRAIQDIRTSVFNNSTNVIELQRIEDVSFHKEGFFGAVFNVGTLRMSTVGDETTYTFPFLDTPTDEVETISKLVLDSHKHHSKN